jgi:predicted helicase
MFADYLKMDFPRIPITSVVSQFRSLSRIGKELVGLHAMNATPSKLLPLRFPIAGGNQVARRHLRYAPPMDDASGRIYINADQYFSGVPPEVWEYVVGGFQVAEKWLKDRVDRTLDFDDLSRYQNALQAIARTINAVSEIENLINSWPIT